MAAPMSKSNSKKHRDTGTSALESDSSADKSNDKNDKEVVAPKLRVGRLLVKHMFEFAVTKYLAARVGSVDYVGDEQPPVDAAAFRMWCRMPERDDGASMWYLPTFEVFMDSSQILCEHMCRYGLAQLMIAGARHASLLDDFWSFQDPSLTYNVLVSVIRVVRKHYALQIYGRKSNPSDSLDAAVLTKWLQREHSPTTILWVMFERTATALLLLFEANAKASFTDHRSAIKTLLRVFMQASTSPEFVGLHTMVDMLVPYIFYLDAKDSYHGGNQPVERSKRQTALGFAIFLAFGEILVDSSPSLQGHACVRKKVLGILGSRSENCEDSWLLKTDESYPDLFKERFDAMLKKMYTIGRSPAATVVHCKTSHFVRALESENDLVCAQAVEAMAELQALRMGDHLITKTVKLYLSQPAEDRVPPFLQALHGVQLGLLSDLLTRRLNRNLFDDDKEMKLEDKPYREAWTALETDDPLDRISEPLQLAILFGLLAYSGSDEGCRELGGSVVCLWFMTQCLDSELPDICECAARGLSDVMSVPITPMMLAVILPSMVQQIVGMLDWQKRGLRAAFGGVELLFRLLEDYSELDVPGLPTIIALMSQAIGPLLLGELYCRIPVAPYANTFGPVWNLGIEDDETLAPGSIGVRGIAKENDRRKLLLVLLKLILRDPDLLGTCFVKEGGLLALVDVVRKVRADDPSIACECLELFERLATGSIAIAGGLAGIERAIMLLTVCANIGDGRLQSCARNVISRTLAKLKDSSQDSKQSIGRSIFKMALERDTASVIQTMMTLPDGLDDTGVLKPEFVGELFRESFEKAKSSLDEEDEDDESLLPSVLDIPSVELLASDDSISEAASEPIQGVKPMVTCAGCGAPEVHVPHRIIEVTARGIDVYCRPECQVVGASSCLIHMCLLHRLISYHFAEKRNEIEAR